MRSFAFFCSIWTKSSTPNALCLALCVAQRAARAGLDERRQAPSRSQRGPLHPTIQRCTRIPLIARCVLRVCRLSLSSTRLDSLIALSRDRHLHSRSRLQQSRLVVTEILRLSEAQERAACIEKWIQVAEVCRLLRNLNGVLEVCAALTNSAVFRLKLSWERVSKQVRVALSMRGTLSCPARLFGVARERVPSFACRVPNAGGHRRPALCL